MTNSLTIYDQFDQLQRAATALYKSNYFTDAKSEAQAIVKVMAGAELGLPPFASMTGIHIIQGKPVLGANVIATLVKNDPRYDYRIKQADETACILEWYENGKRVGEAGFTSVEAQAAGLTSKDNWKKYRSDMLFARAISRGARRFAPGIFGGSPVYTPDEMGADVDEEGNVLEGEIVSVATATSSEHAQWDDLEPAKPTNGNGHNDDAGPLPDDELVISETPAKNFIPAAAALLGMDEEQVKDVLRSNGVTGVPRDTAKRLAAYRQLRSGVQGVDILR